MVEALLKKEGCDVNYVEVNGKENCNTALVYAIKKGRLPIIKLLIDYGAKLNEVYANGNSPMKTAILNESIPIIKFLIEQGADVNLKDSFDATPIFYTLKLSNEEKALEIIQLLIDNGAKIDVEDVAYKTPLLYAIKNKSLPIIKLLMKHGKEARFSDSYCFADIIRTSQSDIINYFIEKKHLQINPQNYFEDYELISKFEEKSTQLMVFQCLAIHQIDFFTNEILKDIIRGNRVDIVKILVEQHHMNIFYQKDENEQTLLDYAIKFHQRCIINYLKNSKENKRKIDSSSQYIDNKENNINNYKRFNQSNSHNNNKKQKIISN